jgi:hypothetical protein
MKERKKFWLLPIVMILHLFGAMVVLTQGSVVAPFIYTLCYWRAVHVHCVRQRAEDSDAVG